jgi:V8-like Glu-specific endopeptidase
MNTFKKLKIKFSAFFLLTALPVFVMFGQPASLEYDIVSYPVSSGFYDGNGESTMLVWSEILDLRDVPWLRLEFGDTYLGNESYLLITSVLDGSTQRLNSISIAEWYNSSAFFNGSAVELELFVDSRDVSVYVEVTNILIGIPPEDGPGTEAICGNDDNRISSSNPAVGRLLTITLGSGCSGWIVENGKHVTAGHCASSGVTGVLQFNVPKSTSNGTIKHPHPDHQYSVNQQSISHNAGGIGNDWAVFEVFNNSNTNLQPIQAQNAFFNVVQNNSGSQLRVTGYGVDGPPPYFGSQGQRNSDNQTQQTHIGSNMNSSGNVIRHSSDTQGGNSGSPIIDESTGFAIGIHTHGGCIDLGYNHGTSAFNTGFWNTLYPPVTVTIDQKWADGSRLSGTTVGRWNGISFTNLNITTNPATITPNTGTTEVFRGYQEIVDNEKYRVWERNQAEQIDSIQNHRGFQVTPELNNLTSRFHDTHASVTIKNVLEGTSVTGGTLFFYDPWLIDYPDPAFGNQKRNRGMDAPPKQRNSPFYPDYTTNYNGDVYKGVFLNQNPQFQSDLPIYNVWAGDQQINLGSPLGVRQFYFQNWSANGANLLPFGAGNQSRVVFTSGDAVVQANLKGQGLSNSEVAYTNNSQRKFLWINPGRLHSVYESMGKVWYETSTDNGSTWQIMNNVSPFGTLSSLPAIAIDYNSPEYNTFITYRECEDQNCQSSFIKFARFNIPGNNIISEEAVPSVGFGDFATNPVIASGFSQNGPVPHFVLVYEVKSGLYVDPGIYYAVYKKPTIGQYELAIGPTRISGTDINSYTPTIAVNQSTDAVCKYHIAWEQRTTTNLSRIRYIRLDISGYSNLSASLDGYIENVSYNNGYTRNHKPSIVAYPGNNAKIVWLAERYQAEEERLEKGQGTENTEGVQYKTFFNDVGVSGFRSYGNRTNAPTINKLNDNSEYYLAYSEQSNLAGKVVIGSDPTTINQLETIGKDIQMGNGANENQVRALAFHSANLPYYFNKSLNMSNVTPKIKSLAIVSGREGVVGKDTAQFYFTVGDVILDDQPIEFVELPDTVLINAKEILNEYLVTNPFTLNDNSVFYYSVQYGITDSASAIQALTDSVFINFTVQLLDANTDEIIGTFDNVTYNSDSVFIYNNIAYQVNVSGLNNRLVKLRLKTETNHQFDYSLTQRYAEESVLGKKFIKQINFNAGVIITEYALEQNYPNPFNPSTTIRYQLPQDGMVTLKVYDILGSEVATLVNEQKAAGRYEINFDASRFASGAYIYKITSGSYVSSKKMLLVK